MTLNEFQALLERHGGTQANWPTADRLSALQLMIQSEEARQLAFDAQQLDRLIDQAAVPPPDAAWSSSLAQRILVDLPPQPKARPRFAARWWPKLEIPLLYAGCAALGILLNIAFIDIRAETSFRPLMGQRDFISLLPSVL